MNTALRYEEALLNTKNLQDALQKEYDTNAMIYKTLKTDEATPDIPLIDFLNVSIPNWTKLLDSQMVIDIIMYSATPSEEAKTILLQKLLTRNQKIIYQIRDINFTINDCAFEIDEKISECDIKIGELNEQIKVLTKRIGKIETIKSKWVEIKNSL